MLKFLIALLFAQVLLAAPMLQKRLDCADDVHHDSNSDEYYECMKKSDEREKKSWEKLGRTLTANTHPLVTMDGSEYNTALIH